MAKPIISGLMAYGMSGRIFHAPFLETHAGFKLKAITERSRKVAAQRYPDVLSYDTVDQLLADDEIELIVVNTPNDTHYELSRKALFANKSILIEKPAAANRQQAKELFDIATERNLKVFVYQNRRWDSDFLSVKKIIESGKVGKLIEVTFRFDRYKPALSPKTFKEIPDLPASGLSFDLGPHILDQLISLFGRPVRFNKTLGINRKGSAVDDYFMFNLSYPGGLNVIAASSLLTVQALPAFVLHGTKGTYIKDRVDVQESQLDKNMLPTDKAYGIEEKGVEGKLYTMNDDGSKRIEIIAPLKGNYIGLFEAVYQSLRFDKPYPITEEDILTQMELLAV